MKSSVYSECHGHLLFATTSARIPARKEQTIAEYFNNSDRNYLCNIQLKQGIRLTVQLLCISITRAKGSLFWVIYPGISIYDETGASSAIFPVSIFMDGCQSQF